MLPRPGYMGCLAGKIRNSGCEMNCLAGNLPEIWLRQQKLFWRHLEPPTIAKERFLWDNRKVSIFSWKYQLNNTNIKLWNTNNLCKLGSTSNLCKVDNTNYLCKLVQGRHNPGRRDQYPWFSSAVRQLSWPHPSVYSQVVQKKRR